MRELVEFLRWRQGYSGSLSWIRLWFSAHFKASVWVHTDDIAPALSCGVTFHQTNVTAYLTNSKWFFVICKSSGLKWRRVHFDLIATFKFDMYLVVTLGWAWPHKIWSVLRVGNELIRLLILVTRVRYQRRIQRHGTVRADCIDLRAEFLSSLLGKDRWLFLHCQYFAYIRSMLGDLNLVFIFTTLKLLL